MIDFPCHCGQRFSVEDDQAGGTVQCPRCGLLNDVPTLEDLSSITEDGTYTLRPSQKPRHDPLPDMLRVLGRDRVDDEGFEKDLRPSETTFERVGQADEPSDTADPAQPGPRPAPRYDPITGELIRPLAVVRKAA